MKDEKENEELRAKMCNRNEEEQRLRVKNRELKKMKENIGKNK